MTEVESEILTLEEVAAYLKAGKRTVYRLAQKGEIPAFKLGGTWRFRRSELDRWIAESISKKKPEAERACTQSATESHSGKNSVEDCWRASSHN